MKTALASLVFVGLGVGAIYLTGGHPMRGTAPTMLAGPPFLLGGILGVFAVVRSAILDEGRAALVAAPAALTLVLGGLFIFVLIHLPLT